MGTAVQPEALAAASAGVRRQRVRAALYRLVTALLREPLDDERLLALRRELAQLRPLPEDEAVVRHFAEVLDLATPQALAAERAALSLEGPSPRVDLRCEHISSAVELEAHARAGLPVRGDRLSELAVLSCLCERAVAAGSAAPAQTQELLRLSALEELFLTSHADTCLQTLGAQLEWTGLPVFSHLGRALQALIGQDVQAMYLREGRADEG